MIRAYYPYLEREVANAFHCMYRESEHTWNYGMTRWKGVPVYQNPLDMWVLQEIIHETKPEVIVETGTAFGGSALFYTDVFGGRVVTIDNDDYGFAKVEFSHPRILFLKGMSTDEKIFARVKKECGRKRVMAILDSDHHTDNVLKEMRMYGRLVSSGCYMVVEDTNLDCNPINHRDYKDDGPFKAVKLYTEKHHDFMVDHTREKFYMTFHPNGWLKKA